MFKFVRKGAKSILGTLIFGAISLVFVFSFGPGANGCQSVNPNQNIADYVVDVNNKKIGIGEYQEMKKYVLLQLQSQRGKYSDNQINDLVIGQLVDQELLLNFAKTLNLTVTDKEKDDYITALTYFQVNGKFDYPTYKKLVQGYFNTTPIQYERNIRKQILVEKVSKILGSSISVPDATVWEEYKKANKTIDISYINVTPKAEALAVTDEEVTAFKTEKDAEIKKYFDSHQDEFTHAKEVEASHILIKAPKGKEKDALAKIEKIRKETTKENFAELAKKHSEGPSKKTGGKLGYFTKDKMVKEFSNTAFGMKVDEISKPVKSQFGYHIILVTGIKEAKKDAYETVKKAIAKKLLETSKKEAAEKTLKTTLAENMKKAKTLTDLAALMPEYKIETATGIQYNQFGFIPNVGISKALLDALFSENAKVGMMKEYMVEKKNMIVSITKINLDKEKFEAEKGAIKQRMVAVDRMAYIEAWLEKQKTKSTIKVHPTYSPQAEN